MVKPDFLIGDKAFENGASRGCTPFGDGSLVDKENSYHVYSEPTNNLKGREDAIQSKKEIKAAIKKYLE